MKTFFVTIALLSAVTTGALAQQQQRGGTPDEQRACSRDVQRFCRAIMNQGDLVVLGCLQQNRPKISSGCNRVLLSHGQ